MIESPLIKINSDSPERIATLYSVGLARAKRIVQYRKNNGPFHTPEELARVDGISLELAITLSPHIDWSFVAKPSPKIKRSFYHIYISGIILHICINFLRNFSLPSFTNTLRSFQADPQLMLIDMWRDASLLTATIFGILIYTIRTIDLLISNQNWRRPLTRFRWISWGFFGVSFLSLTAAAIYSFKLHEPENPMIVSLLIVFSGLAVVIMMLVLPNLLVLRWSSLASNKKIARIYNLAVVVFAPLLAYFFWAFRDFMPIGLVMLGGLMGIYFGGIGIRVLRTGESFFDTSFIDPNKLRTLGENQGWQSWINARLPNVGQQKALKEALDQSYPSSKIRKIAGGVVTAAGGWLLLQVLSAIIQWVVSNWLNNIFP